MKKSEVLFQQYCSNRGYVCTRIEESKIPGVRSPDFNILVNGQEVIVEIKEIEANEDEIRRWRATRSGKIIVHGREPGLRARRHIRDAIGQLRPYATKGLPCVVIFYDNIIVDGIRPNPLIDVFGPVGPYDINVALYGLQMANLRLHPDGTTESLGDVRSNEKKLHDRECVSAVSVLYERNENGNLFLCSYHNYFARVKLPRSVFFEVDDRHLVVPEHPASCPGRWILAN